MSGPQRRLDPSGTLRFTVYVLVSALAAAGGMILTEIALRFYHIPPARIAVPANAIGGLFLLGCAAARGTSGWRGWPRSDWLRLLAAATATYAVGFILLYHAVGYIGSGKVSLLGRLEVILVVALAVVFLGERWSVRHWLASFLALGGAALINFDPSVWQLQLGPGEALTLMAVLVYAIGIIFLKTLVDRQDGQLVTGYGLLLGAFLLVPVALLEDGAGQPANAEAWLIGPLIIARGVLLGISWVTYNVAMGHIGASRCSVLFLSVVFFTVLTQLVVDALAPSLGLQVPSNLPTAAVGGVLIAVAIYQVQRR